MTTNFNRRNFLKTVGLGTATFVLPSCLSGKQAAHGEKDKATPNILWIVVEDMSPHWSCYGETTIQTPNIDRLAAQGARFTNAFVTSPVCSPSRSAMITGMYQTTIGAHHHRSSYPGSKIHLPEHIKLVPEYFKGRGYYTVNGGPKTTVYHPELGHSNKKLGKTDYNFVWDPVVYDGNDWKNRASGQPFFAQIQLRGGKHRGARVPNPVDPADVKIPPYYPDHPVIREDWARYLNSVIHLDAQVGQILKRLEDEDIADSTAVFLWTDHGISHARGKQFLYDEGARVPLIVRWPGIIKPGTVRKDLVSHIDIAATSLYMAGILIPKHMEGRPLFGPDYKPRDYICSARDRCDETLDCIRCIRTERYKYIRNFYPDRSHLQHNRYKDGKPITKTIRKLFAEGKLDSIQARVLAPTRPIEELYDLENDPHEINNLADSPNHRRVLSNLSATLTKHMQETKDLGLVPEPELEMLARKCDSRFAVLRQKENDDILKRILSIVEFGRPNVMATGSLITALEDKRPSVRWWAARLLGNSAAVASPAEGRLSSALKDSSAGVRVEAARALCKMHRQEEGLPLLLTELKNSDQVVRHYAALALEDIGQKARPALDAIKAAKDDKYGYVRRLADRLVRVLEDQEQK
ncbi:MAG: sulfatase-like hydrolase/transferase [Planctomycetota bacterium]|jgi:arylsulfatase A-like enzyme